MKRNFKWQDKTKNLLITLITIFLSKTIYAGTGSVIFKYRNECVAVATYLESLSTPKEIERACNSQDCRALVAGMIEGCYTDDCRCILSKDYNSCGSVDGQTVALALAALDKESFGTTRYDTILKQIYLRTNPSQNAIAIAEKSTFKCEGIESPPVTPTRNSSNEKQSSEDIGVIKLGKYDSGKKSNSKCSIG